MPSVACSEDDDDMSPQKRKPRAARSKKASGEDDEPESSGHESQSASWRTGERRVLLTETSLMSGQDHLEVISLRHPRSKTSASFIVNADSSQIRELVTYTEDHRCWFIDESIESDGKLYMATKVDPLLLVLPYLRSAEKLVPIDHLLKDEAFPEVSRLASPSFLKLMGRIADAKGSPDLNVWKFNESSAIAYLEKKVLRLSAALVDLGVNVQGGAASGGFVKSLNAEIDQAQYLRFAHGILSEHLEPDLARKLGEHMKIPAEDKLACKKREPQPLGSDKKKQRVSSQQEPDEDYSKTYKKAAGKETVLNAKQKALAKNATGTKSITSFFAKK